MMTLKQCIDKFNDDSTPKTVQVDWDGGHCYTYVEYPPIPEVKELSESDQDLFEEYVDEWLSENDGVCKYDEPGACCHTSSTIENDEDYEYFVGFRDLYLEHHPGKLPSYYQYVQDEIEKYETNRTVKEVLSA